jgi:LytS/YehU family sensor histidine kinase
MTKEVEYIESYIAFQKMKSPENHKIKFDVSTLNMNLQVSPLLFMPFIENSFKYSRVDEFDDAFVDIELSSIDNILHFTISNSIPSNGKPSRGAGTGIENVKQRLEILYPGGHSLYIKESEDKYVVNLELIS